ncbi:phosphatidylglycerol lysyltransferase domain-containing protein [Phenylobacterium sp.]|uniref:phosphatidylglycerol lysyltransferase domain-containing protein n=1 Tax=Phenylobacterium sp. TaxID=1871053 RepID=UPI0025F26C37|nr:phosphatidylglycerol lysyltransferase domain-containing protein [Phenylobacterium sp.]MBX3484364.1 bifunctional lysylphosphatidylglycerol flippase/synthetase MprF [Phenylobacterium sp.]MCW5758692.1 bifunctional lysylphosphatidylglycerol flippase/synthetase MprF [Phenylobacterium sp.]
MRLLRHPAIVAFAPWTAALLTLGTGALLLASGARPSLPGRFVQLLQFEPVLAIEISHFASSVLGLLLVMLAFGLRARLDAAWAATVVTLLVAAPLSLAKGFVWEETAMLLALAAVLAPFHHAFPRKAALTRMDVTPGWLFSAACFVVGAGMIGLWSFENADYGEMPWWRVMADADAARSLRAWAGAAIALLAFGVWRLLGSAATPPIVGEEDPDFDRVRAILAKAELARPTSNLALLGDKRFLFSASGESFLMFGVRSRSWIALGSTVGRRDERLELLWRFRELADSHAARPGFYNLEADDLPDIVELGFAIQKMGEGAVSPLESFTIEGTKRGNLRRAWRRAGDDGATFEVVQPSGVPPLMPDLRRISDAWLETHAGGEKGFSLGGFDERYIEEFPVALVRWEGRIIAFATLWPVANRTVFSIDLMRFVPEGPPRIMDFLFVELIRWGQAEGYGAFDFGMAPLSGLDDRPLAPALSRVGRLIYDRGEEIYNFQGVRHYKSKYDPSWQPRFVAAPRKWAIPRLMADAGLLSSGGVAGLAKRPRKAEEPPAAREAA